MLILGLMVAGARIWFARASLTVAAEAGARAASLERNPGAAQGAAESAVRWNLDASEVRCAPLIVGVDATILGTSAGRAGLVTTTLQCRLSLRDVALPGLPGTLDVGADGTAVADTYRSRG